MSTNEIIYLSSEDEASDAKTVNGSTKVPHDIKSKKNGTQMKKRRISPVLVVQPPKKKIRVVTHEKQKIDDNECNDLEVIGIVAKTNVPTDPLLISDKDRNIKETTHFVDKLNLPPKGCGKPVLVVKEKHPVHVSNGRQDVFSMFLGQCLLRDKTADMKKIVEKLKRKYEQLNPEYAQSDEFTDLLNEKRQHLMTDEGLVYRHIAEVNDVMKARQRTTRITPQPSCSSSKKDDASKLCKEEDGEKEDSETIRKQNRKIRMIEKAMEKVEKRIKKYEQSEVDLDDDDNSTFLKTERYKKRMVDLYAKWCELTGHLKDAGRTYLRPIHLKLTGIVTVDQAINSFINSNLAKKTNPMKKNSSAPNTLIFPDYVDIHKLIHAHNVAQNLGMDIKAEKATAKAAFIKLGEYLKSARQRDFYDTFSVMYEQAEDPAVKHEELMKKLRENRDVGEKNMNAIFDEYSKKQEVAKSLGIMDDPDVVSDKEDEDEEGEEEEEDDEEEEDEEEEEEDEDEVEVEEGEEAEEEKDDDGVGEGEKQDEGAEDQEKAGNEKMDIGDDKRIENNSDPICIIGEEIVEMPDASSISPKEVVNIDEADIDEINIEQLQLENSIPQSTEDKCANDKPILKLRSFAKPPGHWQNSQENKEQNSDGGIETSVDSEPEIIVLDITENTIPQVARNDVNTKKAIVKSANVQQRLITIPLKSTNKDVKIFRRLVTIPVSKLTSIPKSSLDTTNIPSLCKNSLHQNTKGIQLQEARLVPLSAIEIRNQKTPRPVAHIVGQRKVTPISSMTPKHDTIKTINSKVVPNLCINPIAKVAQGLTNISAKPSTAASLIKTIPIILSNNTVKHINVEVLPQKVINPLVKQQNNENLILTSKVIGCKKNINSTGGPSNFMKR